MFHRIKHLLGLNSGKVYSFKDTSSVNWVGFKCCKCGKIDHLQKSIIQDDTPISNILRDTRNEK